LDGEDDSSTDRRPAHRSFRENTVDGFTRVSNHLPELLDAKALRLELGVTRAAAEAIMRRLPVVEIEGLRKVYVKRSDVARLIDERTFSKDRVPA
jgi:hypothetical protein